MDGSIPFWMYIIGFPLLLGPLVTLHELGHYLVGRLFGTPSRVDANSARQPWRRAPGGGVTLGPALLPVHHSLPQELMGRPQGG